MTKPIPEILPTDADLARVALAWPALPEPIRRAILALIGSGHYDLEKDSADP